MKYLIALIAALTLAVSTGAHAKEASELLSELQHNWAKANYELQGDEQEKYFETLLEAADEATKTYPDSAELYIWSGIIKSTYAGVAGGLSALKYVKASKKDLEKAMEINDSALDGSAYTSLGTLYYKVPGWPISFGDDDKAEELLKHALEINPKGIDPNYFYGDFLLEEGRYDRAKTHFNRALHAPDRPDRPLADAGRRKEIEQALMRLEKER